MSRTRIGAGLLQSNTGSTDAAISSNTMFADGVITQHALSSSIDLGGGATGGGADQVFFEGDVTISASYTITTDKNALVVGPVTVANGVAITVPSGSRLVVV